MNGDDMTRETNNGDDFWGATPDWDDAPSRSRRQKRSGEKRSGDVTGAIKGLWASAMTAGADATREHKVFDATSTDPTGEVAVGPHMFDDIDDDFFIADFAGGRTASTDDQADFTGGRTGLTDGQTAFTGEPAGFGGGYSADFTTDQTGDVPVIDVFDEDTLAAVAPVSMSERDDRRRRPGAIDPLLVRIGAVAIATTLLVPLAIGLSSGGDDVDTLTSATTEVAAAAPAVDTTPTTDASVPDASTPDAGTAAGTAAGTPAGLDPDSLPAAVPVDQDSADTSAASGGTASDDNGSTELVAESAMSESEFSTSSNESSSGSDVTQDDASDGSDASDDGVDEAATADDGADRVADCAVDYSVVAGDFWLRLAEAANVPLDELLDANGASVDTPLYPGSEICLPAGATTPAPPTQPAATTPADTDAPTSTTPTTDAPTTTAPPTTDAPTATPTTTPADTTPADTTPADTTPMTDAPAPTPNSDAAPSEVEQIIRDVWPDELEERALTIAFRESRYVPTAKNYCCYGLFQIYWEVHKSWLTDMGITNDTQLYDPATNARAAYALYQRSGGWGPWSQTDY